MPAASAADESASASPGLPSRSTELDAQDLALLREIDLVVDWELLQEWDPVEDLPIRVGTTPSTGARSATEEPDP